MFIIASIPGTGTIFTVRLLNSLKKEVQLCDNSMKAELFSPAIDLETSLNKLYQKEALIFPKKVLLYGHLHFSWMQFILRYLRLDDELIIPIRHPFNIVRTIYRRDLEIEMIWRRLDDLLTFLENPQKKLLLPIDLFKMYDKNLRLKEISHMFKGHLGINELEHKTIDLILKWKPENVSDNYLQFSQKEANKLLEYFSDTDIWKRLNKLGLPYDKYPPNNRI